MKILLLAFSMLCVGLAFGQDTLTKSDLITGEKILGLTFTTREVDSMYLNVKNTVREIKKMHQAHLGNEVPMSLWQSPVLPGMTFNDRQEKITWTLPINVNLPKNKNELAFYSILQLASLLKNKKITSVELTRFYIDRLKKFGDTLQCVISLTEDIAMTQANLRFSISG